MLYLDTETHLIKPGCLAPKLVCWSFQHTNQEAFVINPDGGRSILEANLRNGGEVCGHNIFYDLAVACAYDPELLGPVFRAFRDDRVHDTKIHEQLVNIARGWSRFDRGFGGTPVYTLARLAEKHLGLVMEGKEGEDVWRLRYHELDGVPLNEWPAEALEYARNDALVTGKVWEAIRAKDLGPLPATFHDQMRAGWALHLMACYGVRTDPEMVPVFEASLKERIDKAYADLMLEGVIRTDGSKNLTIIRQMVQEGFEALGKTPPLTTSGQVSTDEDTLRASEHPVLAKLAGVLKDSKEYETFVPSLRRGTRHAINPGWNVLVASNRTSCREPNMQNLPRRSGVRDCVVPRPGNVFISVDYSVAELRALAQLCLDWFGESALAEVFRAGKDPHLQMAANILGRTYEDCEAHKEDQEVKDARQLAKVANFGYPGGLGPDALVDFAWSGYQKRITPERSKALKAEWMDSFPETQLYFRRVADMTRAGSTTYVHTRTGFVRGDVGYTDGCNHGFQSLVASGAKLALWRVAWESYMGTRWNDEKVSSPLAGFRPVLFVHDEIIGEAPEAQAHEMAMRLSEVMVEALATYIPDMPVLAEPALMRRWYKDAKPVWVDGRLVPWEPKKKEEK